MLPDRLAIDKIYRVLNSIPITISRAFSHLTLIKLLWPSINEEADVWRSHANNRLYTVLPLKSLQPFRKTQKTRCHKNTGRLQL